jgi:hypothetical protein
VKPVLVRGDWQVETVWLDRGTGLREWIEVRAGEQTFYCASETQLRRLLHRHGLDPEMFTPVDTIDDGCE